jgi:hypothetical protein
MNIIFLELRETFKNRRVTAMIEKDVYKNVLQRAVWHCLGYIYIYQFSFQNKKV